MKTNKILLSLLFLSTTFAATSKNVMWYNGVHPVSYTVNSKPSDVVKIAIDMFSDDMRQVTGKPAKEKKKATIAIYQLDKLTNKEFTALNKLRIPVKNIIAKQDAFYIGMRNNRVVVVGSNGRGTAYGILELSRMAGVSPWIWWGDVHPERREYLLLDEKFETLQAPSVTYRGIFINDEDWSTRVWAHQRMDTSKPKGTIGPKTYSQIFRLLLRLRANMVWPAMHEGTTAFFQTRGNKEVADSFDIYVGSSHCEPLLRNNVGEWDKKKRGDYNYITNQKQVDQYWTERVEETKNMDGIYTLGMRGIHDGAMEGVKTFEEKTAALQKVIDNQRKILQKHTGKKLTDIPQVFIPYKEVLGIYENGLRVPDDVTLMWCDDNYGYLTRLSDSLQQQRSGGAGVYYHLSYWGRPHDHLWLSTTQPGLIYNEMRTAYDHNARKLWIANVHDPKVAAYDLSLFLDMAWNINSVSPSTLDSHLSGWLTQQFGKDAGEKLLPVMKRFYYLAGVRKPEFMGWSQVEVRGKGFPRNLTPVTNTDFNPAAFGNELERYLIDYQTLCNQVEEIGKTIRPELKDAYFATVTYPVNAAAAMAEKQLQAQEARTIARDGQFLKDEEAMTAGANSINAYRKILRLTDYYNRELAGGKWAGLMDANPRDLPVFRKPSLPDSLTDKQVKRYADASYKCLPLNKNKFSVIAHNAYDYTQASSDVYTVDMLGHSMKSVALPRNASVTYRFNVADGGDYLLRLALIPTQANDRGDIRFEASIDGNTPQVFSLKEPFRSEQWKQNVLRGQAVKTMKVKLSKGIHTLTLRALDNHIIIDQWMLDNNPSRHFYLFPVAPAL